MKRWGRRLAAFGYLAWALAAVIAAFLAWAASEDPPFDEERLLMVLTAVSSVAASGFLIGLARGSTLPVLAVIWLAQFGLLLAALVSAHGTDDIRVAPPLVAAGIAGELAGLIALALRTQRRALD